MGIDGQVFKLLTDRLDSQDDLLEKILEQAKLTNGKVRDHEHRLHVLEKRDESEDQQRSIKSTRWHERLGWAVTGVCVLLAGVAGEKLIALLSHL